MIETIRRSIEHSGFHVHHVSGGACPRFSYSIGLLDTVGGEVILAGAAYFEGDAVAKILDSICRQLIAWGHDGRSAGDIGSALFGVEGVGTFRLRRAHDSWNTLMLLGALDYLDLQAVPAYQIVPDAQHLTFDVPDLSMPREHNADPAWKWLGDEAWPYDLPKNAQALVNLLALRGARIGEAVRWKDGWHLYASQEEPVQDEDLRLLPLGALIGADPTLSPVADLKVGDALWRGDDSVEWEAWDD